MPEPRESEEQKTVPGPTVGRDTVSSPALERLNRSLAYLNKKTAAMIAAIRAKPRKT